MSIRLGTSRTFSRRANVRRVRGASTEAKTATPLDVRAKLGGGTRDLRRGLGSPPAHCECARGGRARRKKSATSQDSTGAIGTPVGARRHSRTPPGPNSVCGGEGTEDGCDYRPTPVSVSRRARRTPCLTVRGGDAPAVSIVVVTHDATRRLTGRCRGRGASTTTGTRLDGRDARPRGSGPAENRTDTPMLLSARPRPRAGSPPVRPGPAGELAARVG